MVSVPARRAFTFLYALQFSVEFYILRFCMSLLFVYLFCWYCAVCRLNQVVYWLFRSDFFFLFIIDPFSCMWISTRLRIDIERCSGKILHGFPNFSFKCLRSSKTSVLSYGKMIFTYLEISVDLKLTQWVILRFIQLTLYSAACVVIREWNSYQYDVDVFLENCMVHAFLT